MRCLREWAGALSLRFGLLFALAFAPAAVLTASAQSGGNAIYGVTALDVVPNAAKDGVALLKAYRDGSLKQQGNLGVTLLQEADWPNRFMIYEGWKDQAAYDANEKSAHTAQLRDKLKAIAASPYDRRNYSVISVGSRPAGRGRRRRLHAASSRRLPARDRCDAGGGEGGRRGRAQGRGQSALRCREIGQPAAKPHDLAGRLAEPQGVRRL